MTREEAIRRIQDIERFTPIHTREDVRDFEALEMGIKALEQEPYKVSEYDKDHIWYRGVQYISLRRFLESKSEEKNEPCEDAISRQAVLNMQYRIDDSATLSTRDVVNVEDIEDLPPVTPQPKTGWIPVSEPPKELGTYLIQTDGEPYMCQCRWTDVNPFWTAFKTEPHWNIFDLPQYSKVVAWMPLPKPYEPQERSEE